MYTTLEPNKMEVIHVESSAMVAGTGKAPSSTYYGGHDGKQIHTISPKVIIENLPKDECVNRSTRKRRADGSDALEMTNTEGTFQRVANKAKEGVDTAQKITAERNQPTESPVTPPSGRQLLSRSAKLNVRYSYPKEIHDDDEDDDSADADDEGDQHKKSVGDSTISWTNNEDIPYEERKQKREYRCMTCAERFSDVTAMKEHMRGNEGHKPRNQCLVCETVLRTPGLLTKHMEKHENGQQLNCKQCVFSTQFTGVLRRHVASYHQPTLSIEKGKPFQKRGQGHQLNCKQCGFSTHITGMLRRHVASCHQPTLCRPIETDEPFQCSQCSFLTKYAPILQEHIQTVHPEDKPYKCTVCGKALATKPSLTAHMSVHSDARPYSCPQCGKDFKTRHTLYHHVRRHGPKVYCKPHEAYGCLTCGAKFVSVPIMRDHMKRYGGHHPKNQCEICGKLFASLTTFVRHKETHEKGKPFKCSICSYSCECPSRFKLHVKRHSSVRDQHCPKCDKQFTTAHNLRRHIQMVHSHARPFLCTTCGKSLKTKSSLELHIRIHSNNKPYACSECGKKFNTQSQLISHATKHAPKDLWYMCETCGEHFSTKHLLEKHMVCHSDDMPFECEYCGKKFKRQNNRDSHLRTHIGQRKFKCDICGQAFKWNHILGNHMKTHNVEDR